MCVHCTLHIAHCTFTLVLKKWRRSNCEELGMNKKIRKLKARRNMKHNVFNWYIIFNNVCFINHNIRLHLRIKEPTLFIEIWRKLDKLKKMEFLRSFIIETYSTFSKTFLHVQIRSFSSIWLLIECGLIGWDGGEKN